MSPHDMDRRTLLKLSGLSLVGATAGCLEGEEEEGTTAATTTAELTLSVGNERLTRDTADVRDLRDVIDRELQ